MRHVIILAALWLATCTVSLMVSSNSLAQVEGLELKLTGGEVTGKLRGQGRASVTATLTNNSGRELRGVRIGVYYSTADKLPADDAEYKLHEFVLDPPLAPGKQTTLRFNDEAGAEYVLLVVQKALFGGGLTYNGAYQTLDTPLENRKGVNYITTRDLLRIIGGGISYDSATYSIVLERGGTVVKVKPKQNFALVNDVKTPLGHQVIEENGKSLLPLADIAPLFGVTVTENAELYTIELADAG